MYARDNVEAVDVATSDAKLVTPGLCPGANPGVTSTPVPVATTKQVKMQPSS